MSQFELEQGDQLLQLELERYPQDEAATQLQAWEAADEYLLQTLTTDALNGRPVLIFNDAFGTLACALQQFEPTSISDSFMSQLATRHNLRLNHFDESRVAQQSSLVPLPINPGLVVIKIPKTLALLEQQLIALREVVTPDTQIIAGAKARDIHTSTLQLFEKILGPTKTTLARKKARLIHCQPTLPAQAAEPVTTEWALDDSEFRITNHANVFSRTGLDIGARFFMQHLPEGIEGRIADLGCGNGVIGMTALALNPDAEMLFVDESYMAVESSKLNVENNLPEDISRCQFEVNNMLAGVERESLHAVLCNPPFHQGTVISDDTAWRMFCDAKRCLQTGGELRIVGNRHLDYYQKLRRLFGNCTTIATNQKFVILRAVKSAARG